MGTNGSPGGSATPIGFATTVVPYSVQGAAYRVNLRAAGGVEPYVFSAPAGLPAGLTLTANGSLSGTPTAAGTFSFTVQVSDASRPQQVAVQSYALWVGPVMTVGGLAGGQVASPYNATLGMVGGEPPYQVSVTSGQVPQGLLLTPVGQLYGTPVTSGMVTLGVMVEDSSVPAQVATGNVSFTILPIPLAFSYGAEAQVAAGVGLPLQVPSTLSGGAPPYSFAVTSGTIPAGLSLGADGSVSGSASVGGLATVQVTATDSSVPAQHTTASLGFTLYDATVAVDTTKVLATVPATAYGLHTSVYDTSLSDTAALPALLADTGIALLRYPGGSYSDTYHWAQYTTTPSFGGTPPACGVISNGYLAPNADFGNFVRLLQATGTTGMITVNYGSSVADANATRSNGTQGGGTVFPASCSEPNTSGQPQEAAAWVAYANGSPANTQTIGVDAVGFDWKTVGFWAGLRAATPLAVDDGYNFLRLGLAQPVGVKYWEIGNEEYYNGYSGISVENDLHAPYVYANGYSGTYATRAGEAALSPTAYGTNAAAYAQAMRAVDPTISIGLVLSSPTVDPIPAAWNPAVLTAMCGATTFDFAIEHYYPGTYNAVTAAQLLGSPQVDMPAMVGAIRGELAQYCPANAAAIPIYLTEFNANGTTAAGVPAAVTGLFALHELLTGLEAGVQNIEYLEMHDTAGTYLSTTSEAPGPAFYGIELAHQLTGAGDALVLATSASAQVLAHASLKANGQTGVVLVNANAAQAQTVLVTMNGGMGSGTAYSYGLSTTQTAAQLTGTAVAVNGNQLVVQVPAYSAVEVLLQ